MATNIFLTKRQLNIKEDPNYFGSIADKAALLSTFLVRKL